jgi:hypothetical protein
MTKREEILERITKLPDNKLKKIQDTLEEIEKEDKSLSENNLSKTQKNLLNLMKCTINTGRGDFSVIHDKYLYGIDHE